MPYQHRLRAVQAHLAERLDRAPKGPVHLVSLCAGDGRDVIGVLQSHSRRKDVKAWLVELDSQSVAQGVRQTRLAGLEAVIHYIHGDATLFATYRDLVPCEIVLVCGVWGHVPPADRAQLARALASFCKPGGAVIWTRGISKGMARFDEIQAHFDRASWEKVRVSVTPDEDWIVGTHQYRGPALHPPATGRLFNFRRNAG
jgi:hypothetical protein